MAAPSSEASYGGSEEFKLFLPERHKSDRFRLCKIEKASLSPFSVITEAENRRCQTPGRAIKADSGEIYLDGRILNEDTVDELRENRHRLPKPG